eukprot:419879-Prymnesium_polylepis.1
MRLLMWSHSGESGLTRQVAKSRGSGKGKASMASTPWALKKMQSDIARHKVCLTLVRGNFSACPDGAPSIL